MKKLHLIRHAKSSWSDTSLPDLDRPLKKRGIRDCAIMAQQLKEVGCSFDRVFCSNAKRAQLTIKNIGHYLDHSVSWSIDDGLYTFNTVDLLAWIKTLDSDFDEVVIVGHNPAITDLANALSDAGIENVPTCGYVQLSTTDDWHEFGQKKARLETFLTPRMFK